MKARVAALAAGALMLATVAQAELVRQPIAVDGQLADWAPVLINAGNYVPDRSVEQGDPDSPGSNDRDLRAFAVTWDASRLYFYFRRTFSASNSITFLVYLDRDHDNDLDGNDRLLRFDFNGASASTRELRAYVPAATADPITGDGVDEPGDEGALLPATMASAAGANGLEVEGSIRWSDLGLTPGSPVRLHASAATGMNLPGQVLDNTDPVDTRFAKVRLSEAAAQAAAVPSIVRFAHRVSNDGNRADHFNLSVPSALGLATAIYSDPDGDGDPSDGVVMAVDRNGDGDFSDPLDSGPGGFDADGDGLPETPVLQPLFLDPAAGFDLVLEVEVPAGVANGSEDLVALLARSSFDLSAFARSDDRLALGPTTVSPDRELTAADGRLIDQAHDVCNAGGTADVIDLTVTASLGWAVVLWSDPDRDGDPSDGAPLVDTDGDGLVDTGVVAAGQCLGIVARLSVPPGQTVGVRNQTAIAATSSNGYGSDPAIDGLTVGAATALEPDRGLDALPGDAVFSAHQLTNGAGVSDSFNLSSAVTQGSVVAFRDDADCDHTIDSGTPVTSLGPLHGSGGQACLLTQVQLPASIAIGSSEAATSTATGQLDPSRVDSAVDSIRIVHVRTYANAVRTLHSGTYFRCSTIYAAAGGLSPGSDYRFVWSDPDPSDGDERVSSTFSADDAGEVDDRYTILATDPIGDWTVRVQLRQGSSWVNVNPLGSFTFKVIDGIGTAGRIDLLKTDKLNYAETGDTIRVRAEVVNPSEVFFWRDTVLRYVIFQDANGNGRPDPAEIYLLADGTTGPYPVGGATHSTSSVLLYPLEREHDAWWVIDARFGAAAMWSVYMTWETSCQVLIDEATIVFSVGCALRPLANAGADGSICPGGALALGSAPEPRRSYNWSPPGGLSDAGVAQPSAAPAATTVYTLTVTDTDTQCTANDSVTVTVRTPPAADVTPDGPALCLGQSVVLDAGAGWASYAWSNGASTRTITVAPAADASYSVTVTDADGCIGTAAETVFVHPLPAPDIIPDSPDTCAGGSVVLDAGPGFSAYDWSTGETGRSILVSPLATASYTVTVTDANGCQGSAMESLTVYPEPVADITPDAPAICPGDTVDLDGGAGFTGYQWSTGATTRAITAAPLATTLYDLTVTDGNGCTASASETVTVHPAPVPPGLSHPPICQGQSASLDAGPGWARYQWSTGASRQAITVAPTATTDYTVALTDANGCSASADLHLVVNPLPSPAISPSAPAVCPGVAVVLDAGAGFVTYQWSTGENARTITVTPPASASYDVVVGDGNGCLAGASATVTVHPAPVAPQLSQAPVCAGTTVVLDAGPGWQGYLWSTGETSRTIAVSPAATTGYTLTVTDGNGCSATSNLTLVVNPMPEPTITSSPGRLCRGATATLDAGPGFASYLWSTGETTRTIVVAPASTTTYGVTVTTAAGCSAATSIDLAVDSRPVAVAGSDQVTCPLLPVVLGGPAQPGLAYSWSPADGLDDPRAANPVALVTASAAWVLTVTDPATGCSASDDVSVVVPAAAPADPLGNVLRLVRAGDDVVHHWSEVPGLQSYHLTWSPSRVPGGGGRVGVVGAGLGQLVEPGMVSGGGALRYYRIEGRECPPQSYPAPVLLAAPGGVTGLSSPAAIE